MGLKLIPRKKGELNLPLVYLLVMSTGFLSLYILYAYKHLPHLTCMFKTITGIPCPTCGSTRVFADISHWDIISAFHWNPLVFLGGIVFVAWVFYGFYMLFSRKKIKVSLSKKESLFLRGALLILFILNWIYLVMARV